MGEKLHRKVTVCIGKRNFLKKERRQKHDVSFLVRASRDFHGEIPPAGRGMKG